MTRHVEHKGPKLLIDWEPAGPIGRREAGIGSLTIHAVWIFLLILQPRLSPPRPSYEAIPTTGVVRLIMPTREELSKLTKIPPRRTSSIEFSGRAEEARSLIILPGADSVPEKFTESKIEIKNVFNV